MANLLKAVKPDNFSEAELQAAMTQFLADNPYDKTVGDWKDDPEFVAEAQDDDGNAD
jgi:hypothetical protein